jgi:hypothetical protein
MNERCPVCGGQAIYCKSPFDEGDLADQQKIAAVSSADGNIESTRKSRRIHVEPCGFQICGISILLMY